ncbi:hypothetical protein Bca4012_059607 [Brassica carinata]
MSRRFSAMEKGKSTATEKLEPPRTARVKIQEPDNADLLRKHALTLIGKVTNPSAQKVGSLIPYFTDTWITERPPVGADLGNGMFKFRFELESDLLSVLDKRPYHFARWMVILERWEPTLSPSFPSLIPFWIKVQGIPAHLWTEETLKIIGDDIGFYEASEITDQAAKMRVHVNGRLPLIKSSTIEFPSGDEVVASLVYEKLERHCSMCFKLDHELRDCLEAKAQKRAQALAEEHKAQQDKPLQGKGNNNYDADQEHSGIFQFKAAHQRDRNTLPPRANNQWRDDQRDSGSSYQRRTLDGGYNKMHRKQNPSLEAGRHSRTPKDRYPSHRDDSRNSQYYSRRERNASLPARSYYREIPTKRNANTQEESRASKSNMSSPYRGVPLKGQDSDLLPHERVKKAMGENREAMIMDNSSTDPTESAARRERLRKAGEEGKFGEATEHIVRTAVMPTTPGSGPGVTSLERTPALQRLSGTGNKQRDGLRVSPLQGLSQDRIPALQRLGISAIEGETPPLTGDSQIRIPISQRMGRPNHEETVSPVAPISQERIPATQRLGEVLLPQEFRPSQQEDITDRVPAMLRIGPAEQEVTSPTQKASRKPGRPPGKKKVQGSPKLLAGANSRKRKLSDSEQLSPDI